MARPKCIGFGDSVSQHYCCSDSFHMNLLARIKIYFQLCSGQQKIEFRDLGNLSHVISCKTVDPHAPIFLQAVSPFTMMYVDGSTNPCTAHWLDCTAVKFKYASIPFVTEDWITDVIHGLDDECREFLLSTHGKGGIYAYSKATGQVKWHVKGIQSGMEKDLDAGNITADDQGNAFVCDLSNKCIQVFSVSDGRFLGCLFKEGEQGLGVPLRICFWGDKSTLLVLDDTFNIKNIEIRYK